MNGGVALQPSIIVSANRRLHCKAVRSSDDSEEVTPIYVNDRQMDLAKQPPNWTSAKYKVMFQDKPWMYVSSISGLLGVGQGLRYVIAGPWPFSVQICQTAKRFLECLAV